MSAVWIFVLSSAACCLANLGGTIWRTPGSVRTGRGLSRSRSVADARRRNAAQSLPRLVRQLASLLAAGRSGPMVWGALAQVLAMEHTRRSEPPEGRDSLRAAARHSDETDDAVLVLVLAVQRATTLGVPTATAVRHSCGEAAAPVRGIRPRTHGPPLTPEQHRTWLDVAACFEVCEGSGAPVAAILDRLALAIEAEQDAAALRETALAGPRATVRLLSWLPFLGLGLGMAMGVDPLGALLGSPLGWAVLTSGVVLSLAGRLWSARMIDAAAQPAALPRAETNGVFGPIRARVPGLRR